MILKYFCLISITEIIYIYYMFYIFETRTSINHPMEVFMLNYLNDTIPERIFKYLKHPTNKTSVKESKICPMGKFLIIFLLAYLLIRLKLCSFMNIFIFNKLVMIIVFILSLSNLNAIIYLLPYFLAEIYLLF
jgi:hypothetical protein